MCKHEWRTDSIEENLKENEYAIVLTNSFKVTFVRHYYDFNGNAAWIEEVQSKNFFMYSQILKWFKVTIPEYSFLNV